MRVVLNFGRRCKHHENVLSVDHGKDNTIVVNEEIADGSGVASYPYLTNDVIQMMVIPQQLVSEGRTP